jgi:hypothetical protein
LIIEKDVKPKKQKKIKNSALPVWTGGQVELTGTSIIMNVAARFALLCAATAGTLLLFVQLYQIPVDINIVVFWSVLASIAFNVSFIYLKFRYALPLFILAFILFLRLRGGEFLFNLGCLADYFLLYIDSDIVRTAGYSSRDYYAVFDNMSLIFYEGIEQGVIYFSVFLSLLFALSARGKFIGSILITSIIVLIPAIASQKATYVPAMTVLAVSMLGLYSIWASQEGSFLKSQNPRKQKKPPFIPKIHRHSVNGAIAALIALSAASIAQRAIPIEKTQETIDFWGEAADSVIEWFYEIGERIGGGFTAINAPMIDTTGFTPGGSIESPGQLSINNPTMSRRHIMNVTLENQGIPIYLRNGIGTVFNPSTGRWDVGSRGNRMSDFPDSFYPEHEYLIFRQRADAVGYNADSLIGRQRVDVEKLFGLRHIMLPTSPYMPDYKADNRFNWTHDSILQTRGRPSPHSSYTWDVLYPIVSNFNLGSALADINTLILGENPLTAAQAQELPNLRAHYNDYLFLRFASSATLPDTGALRIFVDEYGLTATEYQQMIREYEEMVREVYTVTVPSETENMQRLWNEIIPPGFIRIALTPADVVNPDGTLNNFYRATLIENHFKNNYTYSLTEDNNSGENTLLGNFLFETRAGHCALYATAMTLLLREQGIPARYVTGYVVGNGNGVRTYDNRFVYEVLERDLHAWVEVYFENIGWLPFDPTPPIYESHFLEAERNNAGAQTTTPRTMPTTPPEATPPEITTTTPITTPPDTITTPGETPETTTTPFEHIPHEAPRIFPMHILIFAAIVLLAGVFAASIIVFISSVGKIEKKRLAKYTGMTERNTAREAYRFIMRLLKIEGLNVLPGEVPVKFAQRTDEIITGVPETMAAMGAVIDVIKKLEFSREELTAEEYDRLGCSVTELYEQIVTGHKPLKRFIRKVIAFNVVK